jgi:hypothetical protein
VTEERISWKRMERRRWRKEGDEKEDKRKEHKG